MSSASPVARPRRWRRSSTIYKDAIKDAEPVGEYVNDNVAITTSFMCLEDRDEAIDWVTRSGNGYQQTLAVQVPRHVPEAAVGAGVAGARSRTRRASR